MESSGPKRYPKLLLTIIGLICVALLLLLNLLTPDHASEEWIYTLEQINIVGYGLLFGMAFLFFAWTGISAKAKGGYRKLASSLLAPALCAIFVALPLLMPDYQFLSWPYQYFLSICWLCALVAASLGLFGIARKKSGLKSSLLCLAGSVAMGIAALELALLCTNQIEDGIENKSAESKYTQHEKGIPEDKSWVEFQCGMLPSGDDHSLPVFHRVARFNHDLFDVKYTFNSNGWRTTPKAEPGAENDLLIFGCSSAFGHGLEDEQTWAWKLGKLLGPDWQVQNYGANGWSANHMLCLLEHRLIEKPTGTHRYAVFLSIAHHIRRNEFFPHTPHYEFNEAGEAVAGGKPRYNWVLRLPHTFNGSQLARESGIFITKALMKNPDKATDLYLAMLKKSADILAKEYNTKLIVLLWPDIESIRPRLEEMGIPVILASSLLAEWDTPPDPGYKYRINRNYEYHPNNKATSEIAAGLAHYFKELAPEQ